MNNGVGQGVRDAIGLVRMVGKDQEVVSEAITKMTWMELVESLSAAVSLVNVLAVNEFGDRVDAWLDWAIIKTEELDS